MINTENLLDFPCLPETDYHTYLKEKLVFFYYHSVRSSPAMLKIMESEFDDVLSILKQKNKQDSISYRRYFNLFYQLLCYIRDIHEGKGEHDWTYMMIHIWYKYYPTIAIYFVHRMVQPIKGFEIPYGSWRDIKYLCEYLRLHSRHGIDHPLIESCVYLMNQELWKQREQETFSNIAKWVPREGKQFEWLYEMLVVQWALTHHPYILNTSNIHSDLVKALNKCRRIYRHFISNNVGHNKAPYCSRLRPSASTTSSHIRENVKHATFILNGMSNSPNDPFMIDYDKLNVQWARFTKQLSIGSLKDVIPIVDLCSYHMIGAKDIYHTFIGLACLIAQYSTYNKRILLVGGISPIWVNLENCIDFISTVQCIENAITDIHLGDSTAIWTNATAILIHSMIETHMSSYHIENMTLLFLSAKGFPATTSLSHIEKLFYRAGIQSYHNRALPCPHIVFYKEINTMSRIEEYLPCDIDTIHAMLFSGCSGSLLLYLKDISNLSIREPHYRFTSYEKICNILDNPRYKLCTLLFFV